MDELERRVLMEYLKLRGKIVNVFVFALQVRVVCQTSGVRALVENTVLVLVS